MSGMLKFGIGFFIFLLSNVLLQRYLLPIEIAIGLKFLLLQSLLYLLVMILLGLKFLRSKENILSYGEALKGLFLGTVVGMILSTIISIPIYSGDKEYSQRFQQVQIENAIGGLGVTLKVMGKSDNEIALEQEEFRAEIDSGEIELDDSPINWKNLPVILLTSIGMMLIFSLIAAIFVKQKQSGA